MKEEYLNFDEYIRQGEPSQREKAGYWQTAIGLQAVDSLKTSDSLERFFRNLLLCEQWDLHNSYLHIHSTKEWSVQPNLSFRHVPEQAPEQVADLLHTDNILVIGLIRKIGKESVSISQLMKLLELKHRPNFLEYHLYPAIKEGFVRMLYPNSPRHPRQKYLLTEKGLALYNELMKRE